MSTALHDEQRAYGRGRINNVYIPGIESRALIVDLKETAIATGSACTSADHRPLYPDSAIVHTDDAGVRDRGWE